MKKTRLDKLLASAKRARTLLKSELGVLKDSHLNVSTGKIDAIALPEVAKYQRAIAKLTAAIAAYGGKA